MTILRIEHAIGDFDEWQRAFERGWVLCAAERRGLRGYRLFQPLDDPTCIKVDLEFASLREAESIQAALTALWEAEMAAPDLVGLGRGRARIVEALDT